VLRSLLAFIFLITPLGQVRAAECTQSLQRRWENAMAEAMQIHRILVRLRTIEPDQATLCRIAKNATELSALRKDYFSACDPLDAGRHRAGLIKMEEKLAEIDTSS
jgi:hypothetical protein